MAALRRVAVVDTGVCGGGGEEALSEAGASAQHGNDAVGLVLPLLEPHGVAFLESKQPVSVGHKAGDSRCVRGGS